MTDTATMESVAPTGSEAEVVDPDLEHENAGTADATAADEPETPDPTVAPIEAVDAELEALREWQQKLTKLAGRAAEQREDWESAKTQAKLTKELLDDTLHRLESLARYKPEPPPLFRTDADDEAGEAAPDVEAWRGEPVMSLAGHGVAQVVLAKLVEAGIGELGQLADRMAQGTDWYSKAEAIEAAQQAWFAANPDKCPPVKGETTTDDADSEHEVELDPAQSE